MDRRKDPMGRAILEYARLQGPASEREGESLWYSDKRNDDKRNKLRVFSPMFDEDEIPLATLFREYADMPEIERMALDMAKDKTLDVGAGSGCHSLVLQQRGVDVTAVDISPLSVEAMKERGVKKVMLQDFFALEGQQYDTILMLMNGIGIVGTLERMPAFFKQLDKILAPGGQVLCDSSDISYVFEIDDGTIEYPDSEVYYGEISFRMQYEDTRGEPFPWLYIDSDTLREVSEENGYKAEVMAEGDHYDYLARITKEQ